jgi:hypothetical protein
LLGSDCDVEADRAAHEQSVAGDAVEHLGDDAIGGSEAEQACRAGDDVGPGCVILW